MEEKIKIGTLEYQIKIEKELDRLEKEMLKLEELGDKAQADEIKGKILKIKRDINNITSEQVATIQPCVSSGVVGGKVIDVTVNVPYGHEIRIPFFGLHAGSDQSLLLVVDGKELINKWWTKNTSAPNPLYGLTAYKSIEINHGKREGHVPTIAMPYSIHKKE